MACRVLSRSGMRLRPQPPRTSLLVALPLGLSLVACNAIVGSHELVASGGAAGDGGSSAGKSGQAGQATAGAAGSGAAGAAGTAGQAGTGQAGDAGQAGEGGSSGQAGAGQAGDAGQAGVAGAGQAGAGQGGAGQAGQAGAGAGMGGAGQAGAGMGGAGTGGGGAGGAPGVLLQLGAAGATFERTRVVADATQVCAGGKAFGAPFKLGGVTVVGSTVPGVSVPWIACFDLAGGTPTLRYARSFLPDGGGQIDALHLQNGTLYAAGRLYPVTPVSLDGKMVNGRSFVAEIGADGKVVAATALDTPGGAGAETEYLSDLFGDAAGLALAGTDFYGNSASWTLLSLALVPSPPAYGFTGYHTTMALGTTTLISGGQREAPQAALVAARKRATPGDEVYRTHSKDPGETASILPLAADAAITLTKTPGKLEWENAAFVHTNAGTGRDCVLTRFDAAGVPQWIAPVAAGPDDDDCLALRPLPGGEAVGVGFSTGLVAPPGLAALPSSGGREGWVVRVAQADGKALAWERLRSTKLAAPTDVVAGPNGTVFVVGSFEGTMSAASSGALGAGIDALGTDAFLVMLPLP